MKAGLGFSPLLLSPFAALMPFFTHSDPQVTVVDLKGGNLGMELLPVHNDETAGVAMLRCSLQFLTFSS